MFEANEPVGRSIRSMVEGTCKALFEAYGVTLELAPSDQQPTGTLAVCGVLGFTGTKMRGSLLLAGTPGPFQRSRPAQGTLHDWVGELANQLLGRLKVQLLEQGAEISLSTPVVLQGEHLAPLPRQLLVPIAFTTEDGMVLVWVDIETHPGFSPHAAAGSQTVPTGDEALFF